MERFKRKRLFRLMAVSLIAVLIAACIPGFETDATQDRTGYYSRNYSLGSNPADNLVAVAQAQLGRTKAQMGYTEAWCANFVSDCAKLAGISSLIPADGYCQTLFQKIKNAGGQEVSSPQKGDIVFYVCRYCSSVPWVHVGIMVNAAQSIEGNYNARVSSVNGVYRDSNGHTVASGAIVRRYIRPAYGGGTPIPETCNCSSNYAGDYIVNTSSLPLNIRNSHGGGSVIGSIPKGAAVHVTKANGQWAHVSYGGVSGLCSMEYLVLNQHPQLDIKLAAWFSDDKMGQDLSSAYAGDGMIYLCFKIYDQNSGKPWNEVENKNYTVRETIYGPDGGVRHSYSYQKSDCNWIGIRADQAGTYRGRIDVTGDGTGSAECTIVVKNRTIVLDSWFSRDKMGSKASGCYADEGFYLCYELFDLDTGKQWNQVVNANYTVKEIIYGPDGSEVASHTYNSSDYNWFYVEVDEPGIYRGRIELTGDREGVEETIFEVKERKIYRVSYNGSRGSIILDQFKDQDKTYVIPYSGDNTPLYVYLSANGGQFSGGGTHQSKAYDSVFKAWNTKEDGSGTSYSTGSSYNKNADLTLYAQYEERRLGILETPARAGYEFIGWNTKEDGSGTWVNENSLAVLRMQLYAQWRKTETQIPEPTSKPIPTPTPTPKPTSTPAPVPTLTPDPSPEEPGMLVIAASTRYAKQGDVIPVTISVLDNPGITSMTLDVSYDSSVLELASVEDSGLLEQASFSQSSRKEAPPCRLVWNLGTSDAVLDGRLATLYFKVKEGVPDGEYPVCIRAGKGDIFNTELQNVPFRCEDGAVVVSSGYQPGDVNHDGRIDTRDATLIMQYHAGWENGLDLKNADVNGDGKADMKDATLVTQYYAGWNVKLDGGIR